jgi:sortase A
MVRGRHAGLTDGRRWPSGRILLAGLGILSICAGIAIAVQIGAFFLHSSTAGRALVSRERKSIAATPPTATACELPPGGVPEAGGSSPTGLIEAPALGLVAPVLQGTSDSVLSDAVGHDPASVWPGQQGTSVLSAHDVTWFSRIAQLQSGDNIRYVTPCRTYTYKVTSHVIVAAGAPVYNTGTARLVLDTCYPLNALYITSSRYLVYASLASSSPTHATAAVPGSWPVPVVPAPSALAAQGLGLGQNATPLGTLQLSGSPSRRWVQSSGPFRFEAAVLAEYFGLTRSAAQQEQTWLADLAPSVPVTEAGALWGSQISAYGSRLQITLRVDGTRPAGAVLAAPVTLTGPDGTSSYDLAVTETVQHGKLLVTSVQLTPAE